MSAWLLLVIVTQVSSLHAALRPLSYLALIASRVVPGLELWRAFTYPLLEDPRTFGALWTVLSLWLFGSPIEEAAGLKRVIGLAVAGTVGGAVIVIAVSRFALEILTEPVLGMTPIAGALLIGWGFQNANTPTSFFGLGKMNGKQLTMALAGVSALFALISHTAPALASIGGLLGGLVYMLIVQRMGNVNDSGDRTRGTRKRRSSGERFRVIPGGRDDKQMWN